MKTNIKIQSKDKLLIYVVLLCLFLTTFPLAQGWIPFGDFLPRFITLLFVAFLRPKLLFQKDILLLLLFFLFVFIKGPSQNLIQFMANIMEFALPLVIAHFVIDNHNIEAAKVFALFAIIITTVTMLLTIIADISSPGIVRQMVAYQVEEDFSTASLYRKMGVCTYSFAMISMCMAPVYMFLTRENKKKVLFYFLFFLTIYFVFISGITTCLIICLFMILVAYLTKRKNNTRALYPTLLVVAILFIVFGFSIMEFIEPYLQNTEYASHFGGISSFYGKGQTSSSDYDFEYRVGLYKYSIETFFAHPLFGDALGKIGGHNYFLDKLARYGIIGMIPFFAMLYIRLKKAFNFIHQSAKLTFAICIIGFIALGFLKNMSGIDYWIYMFIYIPCILKCSNLFVLNH